MSVVSAEPTGVKDCKKFFLEYSKKDGYCCDFHANQMVYLKSDVWHLLNPRKFRLDFGFELEEFKKEQLEMQKLVEEGKTVLYNFHWYTRTTERDRDLFPLEGREQ